MNRLATQEESFQIRRRGKIAIVIPSPDVESMSDAAIEQASQLVLTALAEDTPSKVIFDLSKVSYFGSMFITLLVRCHLRLSTMEDADKDKIVLVTGSDRVRELLRMTNFDIIWVIYKDLNEALEFCEVD